VERWGGPHRQHSIETGAGVQQLLKPSERDASGPVGEMCVVLGTPHAASHGGPIFQTQPSPILLVKLTTGPRGKSTLVSQKMDGFARELGRSRVLNLTRGGPIGYGPCRDTWTPGKGDAA
jgi:hypothetical protein